MDPVIQITMDETMKEDTDDEGKERMEEEEEEEDYNTVSNTSSDGYDTDLEIPVKPIHPPRVVGELCAETYKTSCENFGVTPQKAVLKSFSTSALNVNHRELGPRATGALAKALSKNKNITTLDLTDNSIGEEGGLHVAEMLMENNHIINVKLADNQMGPRGGFAFSEVLKVNRTITFLNLSGNDIGDIGMKFLAVGIEMNRYIDELILSHNRISEVGAQLLGKSVGNNKCLRKLDLSWNHIRGKGAVVLCKGLMDNTDLEELDVSWNGFGYEGALALANLIKNNSTLLTLDASNNRINWEGALQLAKWIKVNTTLQTLRLGRNPLTTTGCMDILESVSEQQEGGLRLLDLTCVPVVRDFEFLAGIMKQSRNFKYVHGGVVSTHDVLGQKSTRRIHPMERVLEYMKLREIRPVEMFRDFDKSVTFDMSKETFMQRMKNTLGSAGISLRRDELEEIADTIERDSRGRAQGKMDYNKLVQSVANQVTRERRAQIREKEEVVRKKQYNKKIMTTELPAIPNPEDLLSQQDLDAMDLQSLGGTSMSDLNASFRKLNFTVLPPTAKGPVKLVNMSGTLGNKEKKIKKKKKVKKGKGKPKEPKSAVSMYT